MKHISHYFRAALLGCILLNTHGHAVVFRDLAGDHARDTAIPGATASTYTLTAADVGF